jgi:hypothetical protein
MAEGGFSTLTCHLQRSCCHRSGCTAICPRSVPSLRICHCSGTEDRQNAPTVSCERTLPASLLLRWPVLSRSRLPFQPSIARLPPPGLISMGTRLLLMRESLWLSESDSENASRLHRHLCRVSRARDRKNAKFWLDAVFSTRALILQ